MKQMPTSCTQALDVLAHGFMLRLRVFLLLEAQLVIEAVIDAPAELLRNVLPAFLVLIISASYSVRSRFAG